MPLPVVYLSPPPGDFRRKRVGVGRLRDVPGPVGYDVEIAPGETRALPGLYDPGTEALRGLNVPPPFIHRDITCGLVATLAPGATRQEIVAYRIPQGFLAVIAQIANGLGNISDGPFVTWSLTVDGADVVGFSNLIGMLTPAVTVPKQVALVLNADQRIAWVATNTGGVQVQQAAAMFAGWMWAPPIRPSGYTP